MNDIYVRERKLWYALAIVIIMWPIVRFIFIDFPHFSVWDSWGILLGAALFVYHFRFKIGADDEGVYMRVVHHRMGYAWAAISRIEVIGSGGMGRMDGAKKIHVLVGDKPVITVTKRHSGFKDFVDPFLKLSGQKGIKIVDK